MVVSIRKNKIYLKEHREIELKRLDFAESLINSDRQLAALIPLLTIDGTASLLYPGDNNVGNRITELIRTYGTDAQLTDDSMPEYIYKTYRCSLAHGGSLDGLFLKFYGDQEVVTDVEQEDGSKIKSVPIPLLIKLARDILNGLSFDDDDFREVEVKHCNSCNKLFYATSSTCIFCN